MNARMYSQRSFLDRAEHYFVFFGLLFMIGALRPIYAPSLVPSEVSTFDHTAGNVAYQVISVAIYLISIGVLIFQHREASAILLKNKLLIVFVLLTIVSASWAISPDTSIRRSVALAGTTVFGLYLAVRIRPEELLELLGWAFAVMLVENVILVAFMPNIGLSSYPHSGAWRGILSHKNELGRMMVLSAMVFWVLSMRNQAARPWTLAGLGLSLIMIAFSESRTAWVVAAALLLAIPCMLFLRKPQYPLSLRVILISSAAVATLFLLVTNLDAIFLLLERDETLTDRTHIWATGVEFGKERFWFGYGYRSFWLGIVGLTRYFHGHGHNSFLDLWLELGMVGLGIFLIVLMIFLYRAFVYLVSTDDPMGLWFMMFVVSIVVFSLTSKVVPDHGTITWVLFVTGLLYLSPSKRAVRSAPRSPKMTTQASRV